MLAEVVKLGAPVIVMVGGGFVHGLGLQMKPWACDRAGAATARSATMTLSAVRPDPGDQG